MALFTCNATYIDRQQFLYMEFPKHYVLDLTTKTWKPRKKEFAIGCMYYCNPFAEERFYVRLLLTVVHGPQSFEYLRTVNGKTYNTFRKAYVAIGLTHDDREWLNTCAKAVTFILSESLQRLFITAIVYKNLTDAF